MRLQDLQNDFRGRRDGGLGVWRCCKAVHALVHEPLFPVLRVFPVRARLLREGEVGVGHGEAGQQHTAEELLAIGLAFPRDVCEHRARTLRVPHPPLDGAMQVARDDASIGHFVCHPHHELREVLVRHAEARKHLHVGLGVRLDIVRGDDPPVPRAPAAQGPEEVRVAFAARDHARAVGEHDARGEEVVRGEAVEPVRKAHASPLHVAPHGHVGACPADDKEALGRQGVHDIQQAHSGPDCDHPLGVHHDLVGVHVLGPQRDAVTGAACCWHAVRSQRVPTALDGEGHLQPVDEAHDQADVMLIRSCNHRRWLSRGELRPRVHRRGPALVPGEYDLPLEVVALPEDVHIGESALGGLLRVVRRQLFR
mmetsp:Transcript_22657/g.55934  ORF Transcript_22657/g.55934 Transcript_22657/m.55934 type:complete len:367 (+) Transcript_22657:465-1565(+)